MFDKFDLNGDSKLEFHEIAYFFFNNFHFSLNEAERYAQQQLNNFDINKDGVLDIWGKGAFLQKYISLVSCNVLIAVMLDLVTRTGP